MWQKNVHYLDYNASAGVSPTVRDKLIGLLGNGELFLANPSSRHRPGQKMVHLLYEASRTIAATFGSGVSAEDLVFVSSGTEANQTVLRSFFAGLDGVLIGAGEHSAGHDLLREFEEGRFVREIPLLPEGSCDLDALDRLFVEAKSLGLRSLGVSLFYANNETGVLNPLIEIGRRIERSGLSVQLHLDGAQVWGKMRLDLPSTPASFVTFSSHKIGAPAGSGVIWKRPGAELRPLLPGSQNRGLRAGTENLLGILATGFACETIDPDAFVRVTAPLQERLEQGLIALDSSIQIWGWQERRLSNTTRFGFPRFSSYENWVELLDLAGFAVSHGSACKARVIEPSRVLLAMGASRQAALNSVRVSLGPSNTLEQIEGLLSALGGILRKKGGYS
jgi:cysteine desulfurase